VKRDARRDTEARTRRESEAQLKVLRDQIARLVTQNLELTQKIEVLEQEKAELGVDLIARSLVQATRTAQQAIAAEAGDGGGYTIPELEVTVRGLLSRRGSDVAVRFPRPEDRIGADQLTSLRMTVVQVPPLQLSEQVRNLADALEGAQAAFAGWDREPGSAAASETLTRLTHLLSLRERWGDEEFVASARALAEAAVRFADATARQVPRDRAESYRIAAQSLLGLTRRLSRARRASAEDLGRLAAGIQNLVRSHVALLGPRPR
jgi:cell division septum initiation protein DivIVA